MKTCYVLAASRPWYAGMAEHLQRVLDVPFFMAGTSDELRALDLARLKPRYVFVPHWSWIIPESVWGRYETVIFHMTDLPFGRGGSPLQNLITRGFSETKLSAIRCEKGLDTGPVYAKRPLSLLGSAEEIYLRAAALAEEMIVSIIRTEPVPLPQQGDAVIFKRRTPEDGDIAVLAGLEAIYNHIRMLDADGYPPAFLRCGPIRLAFKRAALRHGKIKADVTITVDKESL